MRVLPVVFDGDSHVSEQDARALAIHEAVAPGVADHVERQWRDLKRVGLVAAVLVAVGVVLLATGQVASGGGLAALGVLGGGVGVAYVRSREPDVTVTGVEKGYWTGYLVPDRDGTVVFDATESVQHSQFTLELLAETDRAEEIHQRLDSISEFPVVMTEETNVEERFIDSLEDVETAIRDSRSHEVRAPVLDRDHPAVDTLSRLSYHAEADPVEAAGVSLTLSEATEQTETFGEFESMANEDHGESVLLDVSEQSREIATQLSDSQEEAAERLNEHIQRAGDMFGIVSYHFYCPDCESDDVTSRLELRDAGEWFCPTCRSSFPLDGGIPRHRIRDELVLDIWDQLWIEKDDQRREVYESIEDQKAELEEREFEQRREEIRTAEERIKDIRTRIRDLQTEAKAKQGIVDEIGRLMVKYERLNEQKKEQFRTDVADAFERIDAETERALAETEGTIQDRIEEAEQEAEEKAEMLREEERQREREKVAYEQARADERAAKEQAMADERAAKEQAMANDRTGAVAETIAKTHSNKPSPRGR